MNNQPNTNERFNYDAQSQEKAVEQINAIAQANGIKYVLICDEDFFTATNDYPELPFTVADAENYKERVLENLMDSFFQESTDVIDSIADKRSEQNKKNSWLNPTDSLQTYSMNKETYIVTNVYFHPANVIDEVYSKMKDPMVFEYKGQKVWLGEDSKRLIMPKGLSEAQVQELAESLMNLDFIHSYQIILPTVSL